MISEMSSTKLDEKKKNWILCVFFWLSSHGTIHKASLQIEYSFSSSSSHNNALPLTKEQKTLEYFVRREN